MGGPVKDDLAGRRFERLIVVARSASTSPRGISRWLCHCDCGEQRLVRRDHLLSGNTRSCGCLVLDSEREPRRWPQQKRTLHACYRVWQNMWNRCANPKSMDYRDYGGRGIAVCAAWAEFKRFAADIGPRPSPAHSLDRIDVDGDYEPGNCRWATPAEQSRNRRSKVALARDRARPLMAPTISRRMAIIAMRKNRSVAFVGAPMSATGRVPRSI